MTKPFKSWSGDRRPVVPPAPETATAVIPPTVAESLARIEAGVEQARAAIPVGQNEPDALDGYIGTLPAPTAPASTGESYGPAVTEEEERLHRAREERQAEEDQREAPPFAIEHSDGSITVVASAGSGREIKGARSPDPADAPFGVEALENTMRGLLKAGEEFKIEHGEELIQPQPDGRLLDEILRRNPGKAGRVMAYRLGLLPPETPEPRDFESSRMQIEASAVPFVSGWCQTINGAARWTVIEEKAAQAIRKIAIAYANACRDGGDTPAKVNASIDAMLADMDAATKAALAGRKP